VDKLGDRRVTVFAITSAGYSEIYIERRISRLSRRHSNTQRIDDRLFIRWILDIHSFSDKIFNN